MIDNGRRGFAPARASGSGLVLTFFEQYEVSGVSFLGAADYETAKRNGVTDTSLTIDRCSGGMISGNRFSGQADLGIYITGGNEAGDADNGIHHVVQGNYFVGCNGGGLGQAGRAWGENPREHLRSLFRRGRIL
ncbi:hypothetical protein CLG85_025985 [Yangia mangrovi]|uniref:Right handed beta helix domain-containing protein n=1 Tax=Alloyangia mangrovi TaxID=1779329 RepID=A0ABT2KRY2_9RHOB|nr:hypothetical protein [Alloyangia mangrovi]MCT4373560.1 hypothetical protein [Alloyangia mangrovi]